MKRIKVLGKGLFGTTYLVKKNGKKFALKVQKYSDYNKDNIKTELEFADVARKHPDQFMVLEEHTFVENCREKVGTDFKDNSKEIVKHKKSNTCINLLYSLKDGTLEDLKLNLEQTNSLIIQMAFIFYLLEKNGYYHCDVNYSNIAFVKTNKKSIKIFGFDVPTHGYIFSLIDYSRLTKTKPFKDYSDFSEFIFELNGWRKCVGFNVLPSFEHIFNLIKKEPEYEIIKKWSKDKYDIADYFSLLNRPRALELLGLPNCCEPSVRREILLYLYSNKKDLPKIIKTLEGK
jgi:hypothetical protein